MTFLAFYHTEQNVGSILKECHLDQPCLTLEQSFRMTVLMSNIVDPDQMPSLSASDREHTCLHILPVPLVGFMP